MLAIDPGKYRLHPGAPPLPRIERSIRFEKVGFVYPTDGRTAIDGVSLAIEAGSGSPSSVRAL